MIVRVYILSSWAVLHGLFDRPIRPQAPQSWYSWLKSGLLPVHVKKWNETLNTSVSKIRRWMQDLWACTDLDAHLWWGLTNCRVSWQSLRYSVRWGREEPPNSIPHIKSGQGSIEAALPRRTKPKQSPGSSCGCLEYSQPLGGSPTIVPVSRTNKAYSPHQGSLEVTKSVVGSISTTSQVTIYYIRVVWVHSLE